LGQQLDVCLSQASTVSEGYKVDYTFLCVAGFSPEAKTEIEARQKAIEVPAQNGLKVMPQGQEREAFFRLGMGLCSSGPLSCILQEVQDDALGPYSTVSLVFQTKPEAITAEDAVIFQIPKAFQAHEGSLPFPTGIQLLKVTASGGGVEPKPVTNATRMPHSKSGVL
jgi:hypothetical protein